MDRHNDKSRSTSFWHRNETGIIVCLVFLTLSTGHIAVATSARAEDSAHTEDIDFAPGAVFDEVWNNVRDQFWDAGFSGVDWGEQRDVYRPRAIGAKSHDAFADVINEMLAKLGTSHTRYFPVTDPRRFQLLGVFDVVAPNAKPELFTYEGIGIATVTRGSKAFVTAVFDGLPAARAGLLYGDQIVSVDSQPFHATASFQGKTGQEVEVVIRRDGPSTATSTVAVEVAKINGREMFETALQASARVIQQSDAKIGYVHIWSYAGRKYHDMLQDLVLWGELRHCDALVLDLRDGWGGANLEYINLFRKSVVHIESRRRDAEPMNFSGVWGKPVVLLTNQGSTSGKELYAYAFKKLKLGEVVGARTAGAVVAGRCILLGNKDVLYLAVSDIKVDSQRLEGAGVQPTVEIERPLEYAAGRDPQLEKAIEILVENRATPRAVAPK